MSMDLMVQAMKIKVGNPLRKLVLLKLADNASDLGECWPSYQHIADQCEISKRSVMNHIEALCECGLIKKELRTGPKGNSSNVYQLNLRSAGDSPRGGANRSLPGATDSLPGAGDSPGGSAGAAPRISHSFEPVNEPVNEPIKHTGASATASAAARSAKQDYSPEFETAWQAYPKRAGGNSKAAAFKAWKTRLKEGVKPEVMLAGVKRYAAYARATGSVGTQYVKQAASFFGPDRHFEESWQAPSAPGGGHNGTIARLSGLGRMSDDFGESGENLNF
ncbi:MULTISPECIES: helix-turn-helix domain-containing protein [Klebsiella]|uniref:Helix-turn-helix domain-containing protein n=1 Tax=Klebsiella quasipneumoniae subsp. quasipneumoniae TaxID=1667327 RepID=A0AAW8XLZ9_9ENTR|nr:helix-turn-helix domain-containing protein [Klebsiella quasipneumoniae]HEN1094307.1 helix-turn-helix domain-containing protein [Escherichia coli]ELT0941167.1 helix-turn-helix domain-containing protein [Klebsiella quasipneumoniae]MBM5556161.1 helix-turn-helix domain-containing protein [Klebsiella quasipneumoniae]MBM5562268.1 helix-turn-helix domain-containing protein [Klebsiella quasipneumoniae]MCJ4448739.1 helix-turn-helix domain-containing protein [Klebsiella quasipneumoniae]